MAPDFSQAWAVCRLLNGHGAYCVSCVIVLQLQEAFDERFS